MRNGKLVVERKYYNPLTGQDKFRDGTPITEDYVLRHYRPALSQLERELTTESNRTYAIRSRKIRTSVQETYLVKKKAEYPLLTDQQLRDRFSQEFRDMYSELKRTQILARHAFIGSDERRAFMAPDGRYAELLVELGRRKPDESWAVGASSENQTSVPNGEYINQVVIPYYQNLTGG